MVLIIGSITGEAFTQSLQCDVHSIHSRDKYGYVHFKDQESEMQRGEVTYGHT